MSTATAKAPSDVLHAPNLKTVTIIILAENGVAPSGGEYFDNISPIDGKVFTGSTRGNGKDIEKAIDAAHKAFATWSKTAASFRSNILLKIAQRIEDNLEYLAIVETIDNERQFVKQERRICRWWWIISGILPASSVVKKALSVNTMKQP